MSSNQPIHRPLAQRWRDVRLRVVPAVTYAACVAGIIYLWNSQWMPSTFSGEVQAPVATVASPQDGMFMELSVRQFAKVTKGQIIGKVALSPAVAKAEMAAIRSEIQIMQARLTLDGQRIDQSYQQLRIDLLKQRVDLAIAKSKLSFAESELARVNKLRTDNISSQSEYELALSARDAAKAEVEERTSLIGETEKSLASMKETATGNGSRLVPDAISAAIAAKEEELKLKSETVLRSPIDGVVTKLLHYDGENVKTGEQLIAISGEQAESIVGFVRQPLSFDPKVGDKVVVRTRRGVKREAAEAQILQVGGRLEFFAQALRVRGFDSSQERGLPVMITIPSTLKLYPGELVDLALKN